MRRKHFTPDRTENGGNRMGVPPVPGVSGEIYETMPDFKKWRAVFFKLDCVCAAAGFLLGCILLACFSYAGLLPESPADYFIFNVLLPALLNGLILAGAALVERRLGQEDMRQNMVPVFALLLIGFVMSMTHRVPLVTFGIFCIPVCMTTVFGNRKMCRTASFCSLAAVLLAALKQYLVTEDPRQRVWLIPQTLILFGILILMGMVAQSVLSMMEGQKGKLVDLARASREAQQRAETANTVKSTFLANMSHEIRTPINAILGMNEMILRENKNAQIADYAKSIDSAGNSLLYLVNDVLDLSKIESGKLEITERDYETASFVHDCYNMILEKAEKKGLELKIQCNPNLPSRLRGDEARLRQIVTNLLSNAVKYTEEGSVTLSVDTGGGQEELSQGMMSLLVEVRDTGIGIKKENLKELFSQFARFDLEKNRNVEGTGLGLAISKQLADLMHGVLQVQSIYGLGSCFSITVPQRIVDSTPMGDFYRRYRQISRANAGYRQSFEAPEARILAVDDVEVNLKVIVNLLKSTRIQVDTARSGSRCLALAAENAYDVILLDHMMPGMDGVETYRRMKEAVDSPNRDTPVIMLTANAVNGVREQYLEAGFADYLSKPVSSDKLEKMLLKYLPQNKIQKASPVIREEAGGMEESQGDGNRRSSGGDLQTAGGAALPAEEDPGPGSPNEKALEAFLQAYPQVDSAYGLSCCVQSVDVYVDVLHTFAVDAKIKELDAFFEGRDLKNYRILVHGIKSASLSVGFTQLSEQARALENAAKEEDWGFIGEHHPALVAEYQRAVDAILDTIKDPGAD